MADYRNSSNYRNSSTYRTEGSSSNTTVPITQGIRASASINQVSLLGSGGKVVSTNTAVTSGVIFDNFTAEISYILFPDTALTAGAIFDNFSVEVSYILFPDTLVGTTSVEFPSIPFVGSITPATLSVGTTIPTPSIFFAVNDVQLFPETLEGSTLVPFPVLERPNVNYEATGDPVGFAIVPNVNLTINRPETVERSVQYLRTISIKTDPYRLMQGRPMAVPKWDVSGQFTVSAIGRFLGDREDPTAVDVGSQIRWIASENFDDLYHRWYPTDSGLAENYWWESSDDYTPVVHPNYTYYIGKEEFQRAAVTFDEESSSHMWSSFYQGTSASETLTIMIVMSLNPITLKQSYYSVIDSGGATPSFIPNPWSEQYAPSGASSNRARVTVYPNKLRMSYGSVSTRTPNDTSPVFNQVGVMTMVFRKELFYTEWFGELGRYDRLSTYKQTLEGGSGYVWHNLLLGRENGSVSAHTANMDVFEINMWTSEPSVEELLYARQALVSAYGVAQ
jgi:hypothetical protein